MSASAAPPGARTSRKKRTTTVEIAGVPRTLIRATSAIVIALCVFGTVLRLEHLDSVTARTPDEQLYTRNANLILERGFKELPAMVREYNSTPMMQLYPPPVRIGYLSLVAGVMKVT